MMEGNMDKLESRAAVPLVCVTDGQHHIRKFLREALSEFRFTIYECLEPRELSAALEARPPDLVILGLTAGGIGAGEMLRTLAARDFDGRVLPFAERDSAVLGPIQDLAERLGISFLPPLLMPFNKQRLRQSIAYCCPKGRRALWSIWPRPCGPAGSCFGTSLGSILAPSSCEGQRGCSASAILLGGSFRPPISFPATATLASRLSDSVISCAVEDWYYFFAQHGPIETAINLPIAFLQEPDSIGRLCKLLPNHTAFEGLIVEINGTEVVRNLSLAKDVANQLRLHKIAISIDDLGAEWLSLTGLCNFPFVEIKVDQKFVTGCADDRLKQSICRRILDLAASYGARTVAEGVETWADFLTVREMGFDLVQGFLFAKPMSAQKFAQTCWAGAPPCLPPARSRSMEELSFDSQLPKIAYLMSPDTAAER
jgi:EAL domain-containing protein (putative c-di-GMP-specific phosphodiesterase class I)